MEDLKIILNDTKKEELQKIVQMEQGDAREFIIPYSLERHRKEHNKPNVKYKSIYVEEELTGFLILALEPDGRSIEFRRIVISKPGNGYGTKAVKAVDTICRDELNRERIWLDVFEDNKRAQSVYEGCGYRPFGTSGYEGRTLLLYEKYA